MKQINLNDAFSPTPAAFSTRVDDTLTHIQERSNMKRKTNMRLALVAAIVLLLALTTAAFATGVIQSIFRSMTRPGEDATVDYTALDELANTEVHSEVVSFEDTKADGFFEVTQSFYDGEQIMLGVRYTPPRLKAKLDFGPGDPMFGKLNGSGAALESLKKALTEAEYAAFEETLREKGRAGVMYYEAYPGDGFFLADGTRLGHNASADDGTALGEANDLYYASTSPLPEAARNRDSVTVTLSLYQQPTYCYIDETGEYQAVGEREATPVTFTVLRNATADVKRSATKKFGAYAARATLTSTLVDTHVAVRLNKPKRWDNEWEGNAGHIYNYQLLADGAAVNGELTEWSGENDDTHVGVYAPLPEGTKTATLRPVYTRVDKQGKRTRVPNPKEDIVFDLTAMPTAEPSPKAVKTEKAEEELPIPEAELIDRAKKALIDRNLASPEALEAAQWRTSLGGDVNYAKSIPVVSGEYRDLTGPADKVPPLTLFDVSFEPDTLKPYALSVNTIGPGHANGNALFGEMSEEALRRWDVIVAQENWTAIAENWLRQYVVGDAAKLKHLDNAPGGSNVYGYQSHFIKVRFEDEEKAVHDVTVNPDEARVTGYKWSESAKSAW